MQSNTRNILQFFPIHNPTILGWLEQAIEHCLQWLVHGYYEMQNLFQASAGVSVLRTSVD